MILQAFLRSVTGGSSGTVTSVTATDASIVISGTPTINPTVGLPYKLYVALLSQTGSSDPVPIVQENTTTTTFSWSYLGTGNYRITANAGTPFTVNKTIPFISLGVLSGGADPYSFYYDPGSSTTSIINFFTADKNGLADGILNLATLEIRIYN